MTYDQRTREEKDEALLVEAYWCLRACERFIAPLSNHACINRIARRIQRPELPMTPPHELLAPVRRRDSE